MCDQKVNAERSKKKKKKFPSKNVWDSENLVSQASTSKGVRISSHIFFERKIHSVIL